MKLPPFKLERYFAKYEFNTEFLLCSSDCEAMSIADLLAFEPGAAEKFQQVWLGYTESQGSPLCGRRSASSTRISSLRIFLSIQGRGGDLPVHVRRLQAI
jgi:hypothetical protein